MKFAIVGLGSMGKRRIRNLLALNEKNICGYDLRNDRCEEVEKKYKIKVFYDYFDLMRNYKPDVLVISVPPDFHMKYAKEAVKKGIHCFIEASVMIEGITDLMNIEKDQSNTVIYPSATLLFHPSVIAIKEIITSGILGKPSNFSYHSGQYLPDWHPWESINDYYVSKRETSGCREIVPFELSWLNDLFGDIENVKCFKGKTIDLGVDIDDVYVLAIQYKNKVLGSLLIDVVSRFPTRTILINLDKGQIIWNCTEKKVKVYNKSLNKWKEIIEPQCTTENGYNENIIEEMYVEEVRSFISSIVNKAPLRNTLKKDYINLYWLYKAEEESNK